MKHFIFMSLLLLLPLSSQALVEARIGYGTGDIEEDGFGKMNGVMADVIIQPPLFGGLGLGLRYEKMKFDIDGVASDADFTRLSALANYRFIDTLLYVGVIGTVGITSEVEADIAGNNVTYDGKLNYSVGVEGGVHLGLISLGAELGKMFAEYEGPTGYSDLDLDNIYAKFILGFGF